MSNRRGRVFCKYFTQRYTLQRHMSGEFFFSISQQIKVNGVTLDECILPYTTSLWVESNLECNLCGSILVSLRNCLQLCSERERESLSFVLLDDTWS